MRTLISNHYRSYRWLIRVTAILIFTVAALAPAIGAQPNAEDRRDNAGERQDDAEEGVVVVAEFNTALQHWPEGLAIDKRGDIYVTQGSAFFFEPSDGWIKKISSHGPEITELAFFEGERGPAGIVVNARGDIFYAKPNLSDNGVNGVYQLLDDGSTERLWGTENIILANGLAFDKKGDLFVSDSLMGTVWRVPTDGSGPAYIWSDDSLLGGCGMGANGVAIWKDSVYVANTSSGLLARIPIRDDGLPGQAELIAGTESCVPDELFGMDGIALDVNGNVYALLVMQDKLVRIDPGDGSVEVLLTAADGLHNPSSITFGTGKGDRQSVFFVNYALFPFGEDSLGPAVLKYDVGVPGLPLP